MRWFEQFLSEDEIVVRDKFNRRRLIAQRKWVVSFTSIGLFFEHDVVSLMDSFGPIDLSAFADRQVAQVLYFAATFIFFYCLIQLPSFVMNYRDYIWETFNQLRLAEISEESENSLALSTDRVKTEVSLAAVRERLQGLDEARAEIFDELGGHSPSSSEERIKVWKILEARNLSRSNRPLETIDNEYKSLKAQEEKLISSLNEIDEQLSHFESSEIKALGKRRSRLFWFSMTEGMTDFSRVFPTLVFGVVAVLSFVN